MKMEDLIRRFKENPMLLQYATIRMVVSGYIEGYAPYIPGRRDSIKKHNNYIRNNLAKSIRRQIFYSVSVLLLIIHYSCKEEKENGLKNDKDYTANFGWNEFSKNGFRFQSEVIEIDGKPFVNQVIKYNGRGGVDSLNSKFFEIKLDDTLGVGTNMGVVNLFTYNKPYEARKSSVIIENKFPDGTTSLDTFVGPFNNLKFGVYASNQGLKNIKGEILETFLVKGEKDSIFKLKVTSYFEKEVYVKK